MMARTEEERSEELVNIEVWRAERMVVDLGLSPETALLLSCAGVDWHDVDALLAAGCSLDLAVRILS